MRVLVRGTETGTVRFIGDTRFAQKDKLGNPIQPVKYAKGPWVGVELDEEFEGKNDGSGAIPYSLSPQQLPHPPLSHIGVSVDGVRYFRCPTGRGIFVRFSMVRKVLCPLAVQCPLQPTAAHHLGTVDMSYHCH